MDDLLREFVTETNESLDVVDVELVRFEQDPELSADPRHFLISLKALPREAASFHAECRLPAPGVLAHIRKCEYLGGR